VPEDAWHERHESPSKGKGGSAPSRGKPSEKHEGSSDWGANHEGYEHPRKGVYSSSSKKGKGMDNAGFYWKGLGVGAYRKGMQMDYHVGKGKRSFMDYSDYDYWYGKGWMWDPYVKGKGHHFDSAYFSYGKGFYGKGKHDDYGHSESYGKGKGKSLDSNPKWKEGDHKYDELAGHGKGRHPEWHAKSKDAGQTKSDTLDITEHKRMDRASVQFAVTETRDGVKIQ